MLVVHKVVVLLWLILHQLVEEQHKLMGLVVMVAQVVEDLLLMVVILHIEEVVKV